MLQHAGPSAPGLLSRLQPAHGASQRDRENAARDFRAALENGQTLASILAAVPEALRGELDEQFRFAEIDSTPEARAANSVFQSLGASDFTISDPCWDPNSSAA